MSSSCILISIPDTSFNIVLFDDTQIPNESEPITDFLYNIDLISYNLFFLREAGLTGPPLS